MSFWLSGYVPLVVRTFRIFPHSWFITGFVTRLTRRVPLVEHELLTLPEHPSSTPVLVGIVLLDLLFYMYVLLIVYCPFVLFTSSGTYPWSFVGHIFHNGQPSHGDDRNTFEVMTSTQLWGTCVVLYRQCLLFYFGVFSMCCWLGVVLYPHSGVTFGFVFVLSQCCIISSMSFVLFRSV
jgi:hypothetical protein